MQKVITICLGWLALVGMASAQPASLLVYRVAEAGIDPYITRIIVTEDFVRLDEGADGDGYALYDRALEVIYNVVNSEQSILVMDPQQPLPDENPGLILQEKTKVDHDAPKVVGKAPTEVTLLANGEVCAEMVVIDGPMADALEGLGELKLTLARVHASRMAAMPLNLQTACDQATNIYAAARALQFGLPLQERSQGRSQSLVDFSENFEVDDSLFELPRDYVRRPLLTPGI